MANILIVDDESRHCHRLNEYLTNTLGHRVQIAGSAERAFELASGGPVDLVLLDIRLPGMDGLTAVARFRTLAPTAPVVIMTAFGTLDTARRRGSRGGLRVPRETVLARGVETGSCTCPHASIE